MYSRHRTSNRNKITKNEMKKLLSQRVSTRRKNKKEEEEKDDKKMRGVRLTFLILDSMNSNHDNNI
ncbi:hypothetical protein MACK_002619 [Theileria orientalis]|uniref:Uncharacterized protein n=1 Tax=Theileria orientalis TaxID=68886 RepID=A0A976QXE3_THEOR|nr:hypothetical protein MACK_002619 [Theileria orientalis]